MAGMVVTCVMAGILIVCRRDGERLWKAQVCRVIVWEMTTARVAIKFRHEERCKPASLVHGQFWPVNLANRM